MAFQVIRVPSDFYAREGLKLTPEYTVGKEIGGGVQGRVMALLGPDGEKTNKLLKVGASICNACTCLLMLEAQFALIPRMHADPSHSSSYQHVHVCTDARLGVCVCVCVCCHTLNSVLFRQNGLLLGNKVFTVW